jgi:hypothetical protein
VVVDGSAISVPWMTSTMFSRRVTGYFIVLDTPKKPLETA